MLRQWLVWHPEWVALAVCVAAWSLLLVQAGQTMPLLALCTANGVQSGPVLPRVLGGLLMLLAMMSPRWLPALRHVAFRSLRQRRGRAMSVFVLGWLLPWLLAGLPLWAWQGVIALPTAALVALFAGAVLWQGLPARKRVLLRCHRTQPLAPGGWRAQSDCLRFGIRQGVDCLLTCGPLMLALSLAPPARGLMPAASALLAAELYLPRFAGRRAALFTALLGCAALG
ncbi:copper chaperone [Silvimonas terrae]|uniref:copper chaperone n=1 Tax=Silvimonas terrae TaxID=300266 RepID=UPI0027E47010|nr:DUF2182 domain-containing protein [Silvimonas terrae]